MFLLYKADRTGNFEGRYINPKSELLRSEPEDTEHERKCMHAVEELLNALEKKIC